MGLTLLVRGTAGLGAAPVGGRMVVMGSGMISSGVDSNGEVEVETPPKPFIRLLVRLREADDVERTSMLLPFGKLLSASIKQECSRGDTSQHW